MSKGAATTLKTDQTALDVLSFAEQVLAITRKHRGGQLTAGRIDQAKHDRDVAAAVELHRLAQNLFLFGDDAAPLN